MSKSLGILLCNLRKEQEINQKELIRGVCSLSTLSRFESGEREPSKILFDALISKLGKNSNKWEIILNENDKLLIKLKNYIEYLIKVEKWEHLEEALNHYKELIKFDKNLNNQYLSLIKAFIYKNTKEYKKAQKECIIGLELTNFKINLENFKIDTLLSENELRLVCLLGEVLVEENVINNLDIYNYWKEIISYVEEKCTDEEYKLNFYIISIYNIAYVLFCNNNYYESVLYVNKGMEYIIKNKSMHYLEKFLLLITYLKKYVDYKLFIISKNMDYECIEVILDTLNKWNLKNFDEKEIYIRPYNNIYSINEVIKNTRNYNNKTQEELILSKDEKLFVGNQSSISNIENGKRTPRKSSSKHFLENLGIGNEDESYRLSVMGDNFELEELVCKIDFYIKYNYKEAIKLLSILKNKIDTNNIYNKQYIEKCELFIKDKISPLSYEEYKNEIFRILSITIKDIDKLKTEKWKRFFTKEELRLLLNIGGAYHKGNNYEEALIWYKKLEEYFEKFYDLSGIIVYRTLLYNLSQVYGLLGSYKKSIDKSIDCLVFSTIYSEAYFFYRALYNIGWCYGKLMLESDISEKEIYKNKSHKIFNQSKCLANLYNDKTFKNHIDEKIRLWNLN